MRVRERVNARYIARDNNCAQESDYKRTERVIKIDRERGERERLIL